MGWHDDMEADEAMLGDGVGENRFFPHECRRVPAPPGASAERLEAMFAEFEQKWIKESVRMDAHAVQALSTRILDAVKEHYESRPPHRDAVFEVLNALGMAAGITLRAPRDNSQAELKAARDFLNTAIDQHLAAPVPENLGPESYRAH